jgi:hypothetical protein
MIPHFEGSVENNLIRTILGPKKNDVSKPLRVLHIEVLLDLYGSFSSVMIVKSRRLRNAGR